MSDTFYNLIDTLLSEAEEINNIYFSSDTQTPPQFSYQVNFSRLELVISGSYKNIIEDQQHNSREVILNAGDVLYIPPNCWNKPIWDSSCSILSILFGQRQVGFSLVSKNQEEQGFYDVQKDSIQTRTGHSLDYILGAINVLAQEKNRKPMDKHLILALLSYCQSMLFIPQNCVKKRSEDLYQSICVYVQKHFHHPITRASIADNFNISANHLSRLFKKQGYITLIDYIVWVRIDRAKFMLKKYPLRLNEIAMRCGFKDANYFLRVFKNKTGYTPSEYRSLQHMD
ncbi:transcriptional regulator [Psychromonas sp. CNPT3]|uniref:helix-turn-helix domain-containing protein n=1 Tax=Psychromonas sp. CNPT3 TaxID=314282 RepID=UPI00006E7073|nr:AraC family transcriptional regulator [Psychromonas sp. CNPT3]AGH80137.1 transcriptional regulator [Psychromonas sp. CNPT3]